MQSQFCFQIKTRRELKECDERHWGICKTVANSIGRGHLQKVRQVAASLFSACTVHSMGTELVLLDGFSSQHIAPNRRGFFFFPSWRLLKPRNMACAECSWLAADGAPHSPYLLPRKTSSLGVPRGVTVKLQTPIAMKSHFEIANELVTSEPNRDFWPACKVNFVNISLREIRVTAVATHFSVSASKLQKGTKPVAEEEVDPLDTALSDMKKLSIPHAPSRRVGKKAPPKAAGASSGTEHTSSGDGSGSESGIELESTASTPKPGPVVAAKATRAFVWKKDQLGIHEIDWTFNRRSKCYICNKPIIPKAHLRAKYAFHEKKFHAYVHVGDLHLIEPAFLPGAVSSLRTAIASDPPADLAGQLDAALRAVSKRL